MALDYLCPFLVRICLFKTMSQKYFCLSKSFSWTSVSFGNPYLTLENSTLQFLNQQILVKNGGSFASSPKVNGCQREQ